jgi:hypothetical protein
MLLGLFHSDREIAWKGVAKVEQAGPQDVPIYELSKEEEREVSISTLFHALMHTLPVVFLETVVIRASCSKMVHFAARRES